MIENINTIWQLFLIGGMIVGGAVWLRSSLAKQRTLELENLADTRGEKIKDLEAVVRAQEARILLLEGQMQAITGIKVAEIVEGVKEEILPFLQAIVEGTE